MSWPLVDARITRPALGLLSSQIICWPLTDVCKREAEVRHRAARKIQSKFRPILASRILASRKEREKTAAMKIQRRVRQSLAFVPAQPAEPQATRAALPASSQRNSNASSRAERSRLQCELRSQRRRQLHS